MPITESTPHTASPEGSIRVESPLPLGDNTTFPAQGISVHGHVIHKDLAREQTLYQEQLSPAERLHQEQLFATRQEPLRDSVAFPLNTPNALPPSPSQTPTLQPRRRVTFDDLPLAEPTTVSRPSILDTQNFDLPE
jgi:hypothetical protein